MVRGSRKHVLDWTSRPEFPFEVAALLAGAECTLDDSANWLPRGHEQPDEAVLDTWGPTGAPGLTNWDDLADWWLVHRRSANRPNWDLVVRCRVRGRPGLALFEAKAHESELDRSGKKLAAGCSVHSRENHERIGAAIDEARAAYAHASPTVAISRDSHYQLSNRLAFSWKLAELGVPNVLVYLGFLGDVGIVDVGVPFRTEDHWRHAATSYVGAVFPPALIDVWHSFGKAETRLILRSRPVLSTSPPVGSCKV